MAGTTADLRRRAGGGEQRERPQGWGNGARRRSEGPAAGGARGGAVRGGGVRKAGRKAAGRPTPLPAWRLGGPERLEETPSTPCRREIQTPGGGS